MSVNSLLAFLDNPGIILTLGAFLTVLAPVALRRPIMLGVVAFSAFRLWGMEIGDSLAFDLFGLEIMPIKYDVLSRLFLVVFHIAAGLNVIYSWMVKDRSECFAALAYPAAAMGGVLAGDWITLFIWWELAALTSVFLVWAPQTRESYLSGLRYMSIQIASGVILLGGIVLVFREQDSLAIGTLSLRDGDGNFNIAALMLFIALGIKSAFPMLHNWVQDAYPKASIGGTIILSVFTTKLAVYMFARVFVGTPELIWIGAIMTIFPIFFALIENDLRKVLTYSINNQVGFMIVGIGFGTAASVNGAVGYAFGNIIFESLLFMSVGAAMYRTGTSKATELGGLYRTMPITLFFCLIGALSISAFPGFAGFVTKGLILDGAAEAHNLIIWLILLFASAGVLEHAGIKIPYFTFFAHDSGKRPKEAPVPMLIAMGIAAFLSVAIGLYPQPLFALLPHQAHIVDYNPFTAYHFVEQLQLLLFAVLAFALLIKFKLYPPEVPSTNLDVDWFYRIPGRAALFAVIGFVVAVWRVVWGGLQKLVSSIVERTYRTHGPEGALARSWPVGFMALWTAVVLGTALIVLFLSQ